MDTEKTKYEVMLDARDELRRVTWKAKGELQAQFALALAPITNLNARAHGPLNAPELHVPLVNSPLSLKLDSATLCAIRSAQKSLRIAYDEAVAERIAGCQQKGGDNATKP